MIFRAVGLDKLDNILQDNKKNIVKVRGKLGYNKNKK
ncbi:hypothetical protein SIXOD_v1c11040 [Spiroplasma ixodetis Y32]|nr:hypothetical protein SIXOD_v1c11040 [Spiroplasma ixodetis Y32]